MKHVCWILVAVVFFWTVPAWAQATATTGQIEGTVTDESKGALPGVTVTVHNVQTGFMREGVSDEAGPIFNARSGQPYSRLSSSDLNFDSAPNPNDRQFINGEDTRRNAFRQPNYNRVDLRISKSIVMASARSLELALDLFNT